MQSISYKDSGVDIHAGYKTVELIKKQVKRTYNKNVLTDLGSFGGLFALDKNAYEQPVLVSGTDGVGTKLMIAFMMDKHDTIGEDCVAMCVNDILCQGAKPLFFLDYVATGKLQPEHVASIVGSIANGCVLAGAALIGGETAEMPGLYKNNEYDIAGFAVGVVDKKDIIDGKFTKPGDILIGLPSSGVHSNGFSMVRKIFFDVNKLTVNTHIPELGTTLGEELIKPTRIYIKPVYDMIRHFREGNIWAIKGLSHITGGGFIENIPRMIPDGLQAHIQVKNITRQPIFDLIQKMGNVDTMEMYNTFNNGIGLVLTVDKDYVDETIKYLTNHGEKPVIMGEIETGDRGIRLEF